MGSNRLGGICTCLALAMLSIIVCISELVNPGSELSRSSSARGVSLNLGPGCGKGSKPSAIRVMGVNDAPLRAIDSSIPRVSGEMNGSVLPPTRGRSVDSTTAGAGSTGGRVVDEPLMSVRMSALLPPNGFPNENRPPRPVIPPVRR